jgi:hypothetical protein
VGRKPLVNNCWYKIITGEKREERRVKSEACSTKNERETKRNYYGIVGRNFFVYAW